MAEHASSIEQTQTQSLTPSQPSSRETLVSDEDPRAPFTESAGETDKEDPDSCRQSKRRKKCPKALEKIEEFVPSNPSFSFTFDTKSSARGPEVTPKFGSFNSVVVEESMPLSPVADQIPVKILENKEETGGEETEVVGVLRVVDEIAGAEI